MSIWSQKWEGWRLNVIMRKQFPQSGPRSTEFGERDVKLCKITFNAGLLFLSGLSFGCIQINWTNRQFMAVGLIDKYLKNAVRMSVWAADYSWDSLMVTGPCGLGPAISKHGGLRQHNFDCNFLLHSEMHSGGRGLSTGLSLVMDARGARFWRRSRTSCQFGNWHGDQNFISWNLRH